MLTQSNKKNVDIINVISVDVETNDKLKELTGPRLSLLLDQVLNDSTYRDNARYSRKRLPKSMDFLKQPICWSELSD
jgi:hypothetical protein